MRLHFASKLRQNYIEAVNNFPTILNYSVCDISGVFHKYCLQLVLASNMSNPAKRQLVELSFSNKIKLIKEHEAQPKIS